MAASLCDHAERVGHLGGEFDVVAQIRFRLRAVVLPQFREGFAIAIFRAHTEVTRDGVQTPARLPVAKLPGIAQINQLFLWPYGRF